MQITQVAAAPANSNPWNFPPLSRDVAQRAADGFGATRTAIDRLLDRSRDALGILDRDLRSGTYGADAIRAVQLLTRARDYALETITTRHLSREVMEPIIDWIRSSGDERTRVVSHQAFDMRNAVENLLDDDEGNVRDELHEMYNNPSERSWRTVRRSLDFSIESLYGARDASTALHVLRAAGGLTTR